MFTIAAASFREALKKKIFLLLGILTLVYLIILSLLIFFVARDIRRSNADSFSMFMTVSSLISVLGFYFSGMLIAFLTIMVSVGAVSSEIESGIIHGIITKPLKRTEYILGKYIGLAILLTAYSAFLYLAIITIPALMNIPAMNNVGFIPLFKGLLLFILEPLVILSLCIFGSVNFKTLNNGIFVIAIYILGLIGGMMEQIGSMLKNDSLFKWGIISSLISPFDTIYRKMLSTIFASIGFTNPLFGANILVNTIPSDWMMLYIFVFTAGFIYLAVKRFRIKDI